MFLLVLLHCVSGPVRRGIVSTLATLPLTNTTKRFETDCGLLRLLGFRLYVNLIQTQFHTKQTQRFTGMAYQYLLSTGSLECEKRRGSQTYYLEPQGNLKSLSRSVVGGGYGGGRWWQPVSNKNPVSHSPHVACRVAGREIHDQDDI
jgi:hypothetical protein